jgi:hypothetical protein
MYKDPNDAPKSIKISEDGTISVNIFEGLSKGELLKYENEGLEFVERAGLTEDQKQDNKETMKKTFKELMKVGFIPNAGDARGFFAPTALMYNNEVYYLESNAFSGKVKPQSQFEYYLPVGTQFTYKKGDSYGTAKTTPIGFVFGSVPTTTEILEVKRERRAERQSTAIPAEMNTTQEPVQKSIERAPEVSTQGSPRDILANNGIAFTIDPVNGFTYFDEQGNVISKYKGKKPGEVAAEFKEATNMEEENPILPNSPVNALTLELKDVLDDKASFMEYVIGQGVPQDKAELIWKGAQAVKTAPQKMRMNFVQNSIEKHKTCE